MLEGIEQQSQQSELLQEVQAKKKKLVQELLAKCLEFEKFSGLEIHGIEIQRVSTEGIGARPRSILAGVNVRVQL